MQSLASVNPNEHDEHSRPRSILLTAKPACQERHPRPSATVEDPWLGALSLIKTMPASVWKRRHDEI